MGPPYLESFTTGPNNSCIEWYIDKSGNFSAYGNGYIGGNLTVTGNSTVNGLTVYTPTQVTGVSTSTVLNPTSTYVQVLSSGGVVAMNGGTYSAGLGSCAISTMTATNGQYLVLTSTNTTGYITISTGSTSCVSGPTSVLSTNGKAIALIFESAESLWKQVLQ